MSDALPSAQHSPSAPFLSFSIDLPRREHRPRHCAHLMHRLLWLLYHQQTVHVASSFFLHALTGASGRATRDIELHLKGSGMKERGMKEGRHGQDELRTRCRGINRPMRRLVLLRFHGPRLVAGGEALSALQWDPGGQALCRGQGQEILLL